MAIFLILFALAILILLLYTLTPKGTSLHEVLHLPAYWLQLYKVDTSGLQTRRINYGDHSRQYFVLVPPIAGRETADKLIIYFHGGGWKFGRPEKFTSFALPFHEEGLPVILPSVRRTPGHNYYHMREDLNRLLLAVVDFQKSEGWHGQKIVLGGMSAGGNLAALLFLDRKALAPMGIAPDAIFSGLFVCGAPLDLAKMRYNLVVKAFAGKRNSRQFALANPLTHLPQTNAQPILCIHGENDGMVAYASASSFHKHYKDRAPEAIQFIPIPGGTHLDAGSWSFASTDLKREILSWIQKL